MKVLRLALYIALVLFLGNQLAFAEYCATGEIEAQECWGVGFEVCKFVEVDAVKGDNGQLYTVNNCYSDVSDYDKSKGRCWITTKSRGAGLWSWAVNTVSQPEFLHKNDDGEYEEIDAEYLTFKCTKR